MILISSKTTLFQILKIQSLTLFVRFSLFCSFSHYISIMTTLCHFAHTKPGIHLLQQNPSSSKWFIITQHWHQPRINSSYKTGNRGLEIYCHGLGSLVLVAVYIGMHYGDGWNYSESSITLWYERTYWCEAFRNSKIHNLVLEQMNVLINSIKVVFECNSRCGYVYVVACLYKSYETYKNNR